MTKLLLSLRKSAARGTAGATWLVRMTIINAICPISTRTAFFGSRRIAPAAPTSRSQGWGARPSVEEERPAQHNETQPETRSVQRETRYVAGFVAQVLSQASDRAIRTPATASACYEAAERVDSLELRWLSASV